MRNAPNQFLASVLEEVPRLLGQLNRNPASCSYGSFDRAYWHYRTNDISCARYQEAAYTLTLLYAHPFEGNTYHRDPVLLEWIRAALRFTAGIQRRDGSFDEWYVNEGSYVATAFVTAATAQAMLLLKAHGVSVPEERQVLEMLTRAGRFLVKRKENTVLNQVSGAVFALKATAALTGEEALSRFSDALLGEFLNQQSGEGWWSEYGGPDIGYLSLTVSYLQKYRQVSGAENVREPMARACAFIRAFVHPDGTAGGEYMARNTEYLIPSPALPHMGAVTPQVLDDRYLCYILYNWIETGLVESPRPLMPAPGEAYFPESGLVRAARGRYLLVANGYKGGSFRIYAGGQAYYDSGLEIRDSLSTGILDAHNEVTFSSGTLSVKGAAKEIREPLLTTARAVLFKLWQLCFGRFPFLQRLLKRYLRGSAISSASASPVSFERTVSYDEHSVTVADTVGGTSPTEVRVGVKASYSAVPSAKYAPVPEVTAGLLTPTVRIEEGPGGVYSITRVFSFS